MSYLNLQAALQAQQMSTTDTNVVPLHRGLELRQQAAAAPSHIARGNRSAGTAFVAASAEPMSIATMANVKSAARRHATPEAALMSMINAAGVYGKAAQAVAEKFQTDSGLNAQLRAAYLQSNQA